MTAEGVPTIPATGESAGAGGVGPWALKCAWQLGIGSEAIVRVQISSAIFAAACGLAGCSSGGGQDVVAPEPPPPPPHVDVPDWVLHTPVERGQVCATGAVDPTFYRQDGRNGAADSARNELARTIQVKVSSVMYDEQTTSGSNVDQAFVTQVVGSISDVVLSGAQVRSYWYDEYGNVSRKGMTYALACMPTDESVAQLADRLKQVHPDEQDKDKIEQVKARAKAAFDELETMENKKEAATAGVK